MQNQPKVQPTHHHPEKEKNSLTQKRNFCTIIFTFSQKFAQIKLFKSNFLRLFFPMSCNMAHLQGKIEQKQFPSSISNDEFGIVKDVGAEWKN